MPVTIKEKHESRTFRVTAEGAEVTRLFFGRGTDSELEIYSAILSTVEPIWDGLIRTAIRTPTKQAGGLWQIEVEYGDPSGNGSSGGAGSGGTPVGTTPTTPTSIPSGATDLNPVNDGMEFTFDTTIETQHITQSIALQDSVLRGGGSAPTFNGAIGVTADGKVTGVDVMRPKSSFTITNKRPNMNLNLYRTFRDMTATTNEFAWGGFEAGEVLYKGCNAQGTQRGEWTVNHHFDTNPNRVDVIIIPGELIVPLVRGWEYLWVYYTPDPDTTTGGIAQPEAAYVEQVYYSSDFADLEIGI